MPVPRRAARALRGPISRSPGSRSSRSLPQQHLRLRPLLLPTLRVAAHALPEAIGTIMRSSGIIPTMISKNGIPMTPSTMSIKMHETPLARRRSELPPDDTGGRTALTGRDCRARLCLAARG